jgi:hypothetical protein
MNRRVFLSLAPMIPVLQAAKRRRKTEVAIRKDGFLINGQPTYRHRTYQGRKVEGLLMNVRLVQGIFDDLNPATRNLWVYPDTGKWDPERNTTEFLAALGEWRQNGVLAFTINLQGGTPGPGVGHAGASPTGGARGRGPQLENSALDPDGNLRSAYMARLARILDHADELGMVVILGYFYFGQDQHLRHEAAVRGGVVNATNWLLDGGYRNVLVEVANECNLPYHHEILKPPRIPELIELVKSMRRNGKRLLAGTSWGGRNAAGAIGPNNLETPVTANVAASSDFILIHGNGPNNADLLKRMIRATRALPTYRTMPVLVNEDPNFHFTEPTNHILAAVEEYVSWGYYDQGENNYIDGFQSPPVNWRINTEDKRQFAAKVRQVTGA